MASVLGNLFKSLNQYLFIMISIMVSYNQIYANDRISKVLDLEWEEVDGAYRYQVQIFKKDRKEDDPPIVEDYSEVAQWKGRLRYGFYEMRLRTLDERKVPGEWSIYTAFEVKADPPKLQSPADNLKIKSTANDEQQVSFKWDKISGIDAYEFELSDSEGNLIKKERVEAAQIELNLKVAKKYKWKVTSLMFGKVKGEIQEKDFEFTLIGKQLVQPLIVKPRTEFVREIEWSKPEFTENYSYVLYRIAKKKNGKRFWKKIEKNDNLQSNKIPLSEKYPGGDYRVRIKAKANLRTSSKLAEIKFKVRDGDRSPAAAHVAELKESIQKPKPFYFVASYYITELNYAGLSYDNNTNPHFSELGGVGSLGLGYTTNNSNWGYVGNIAMAGFTLQGVNYTYASFEVGANYKKLFGLATFRSEFGLYYSELPQLIGTSTSNYEQKFVKQIGIFGGADFWKPISAKLGYRLRTRFYVPLSGIETPNGEASTMDLSYQLGFFGSLRMSENIIGFAGYNYRVDKAMYESGTSTYTNSVEITGHYLNLILEWSF